MSAFALLYRPLWSRSTYLESAFLLVGLVSGIVWFTLAVTLYAVGLSLAVVWVGIPILVATQRAMRWVAAGERWQVNTLLGTEVPDYPPLEVSDRDLGSTHKVADFAAWMRAVFRDLYSWHAWAWIAVRLVTGPIGFALTLSAWVILATLTLLPLTFLIPGDDVPSQIDGLRWVVLAGPIAAAIVAPMLLWSVRGFAALHRGFAWWALGPCEAELTKAATQRAELAEQQVRIDQELHDSIGHMITMNIVQAGAGAHVFESDPAFARQALRNIEERGRVAMSELDRIIATIRGDEALPLAPLPGIDDITGLIEQSRAAGVDIEAVVTSEPVAQALGRAAYGIVREGVTNAAKHAPGSHVHVHVALDGDALGIAVINSEPSADAVATGRGRHLSSERRAGVRHGLAGIRDRVALLGGLSAIGPTSDGGFAVRALIPTAATLSPTAEDAPVACCTWLPLRERVEACE